MSETANQICDTEVSAGGLPCGAAPLHVALLLAPEESAPPKSGTERRYSPMALCDAVLELQASGVKKVTLSAFGELSYWACREGPSEARRFGEFLAYATPCLVAAGIRVSALGTVDELPSALRRRLEFLTEATRAGSGMELTLLVSYAGLTDVVETARHLAALVHAGRLIPDDIDEELFRARMQAGQVSDFDLCICHEGAHPADGLFPFQAARAESFEISPEPGELAAELGRVLGESAERSVESGERDRASRVPVASDSRIRATNVCGTRVLASGGGA